MTAPCCGARPQVRVRRGAGPLGLLAALALLLGALRGGDGAAEPVAGRWDNTDPELDPQQNYRTTQFADRVPKVARIGVPTCASFPFCERIPMPPPQALGPQYRDMPFRNIPGIDNAPVEDNPFDKQEVVPPGYVPGQHRSGHNPEHDGTAGGLLAAAALAAGAAMAHCKCPSESAYLYLRESGGVCQTLIDSLEGDQCKAHCTAQPLHKRFCSDSCDCPTERHYRITLKDGEGDGCTKLLDALDLAPSCHEKCMHDPEFTQAGCGHASCDCPSADSYKTQRAAMKPCESLLSELKQECVDVCKAKPEWASSDCVAGAAMGAGSDQHDDLCACPSVDELRGAKQAGSTCSAALQLVRENCRAVCAGRPSWGQAGCEPYSPSHAAPVIVVAAVGAAASLITLPVPHVSPDPTCNCPYASDYKFARREKFKCASLLRGLNLSPDCQSQCAGQPEWSASSCEPFAGARSSGQESPQQTSTGGKTTVEGDSLPPLSETRIAGGTTTSSVEGGCKCPASEDFTQAVSSGQSCESVLMDAGLPDGCPAECRQKPSFAACRELESKKATGQGSLPAGATPGTPPEPPCTCPEAAQYASVLKEASQTCAGLLEAWQLTPKCAEHCRSLDSWAAGGCDKKPDGSVSDSQDRKVVVSGPAPTKQQEKTGGSDEQQQQQPDQGGTDEQQKQQSQPSTPSQPQEQPQQPSSDSKPKKDEGLPGCFCPDHAALSEAKKDGHSCEEVIQLLQLEAACAASCRTRSDWTLAGCSPPTGTKSTKSSKAADKKDAERCTCPTESEYREALAAGDGCADLHLKRDLKLECSEACQLGASWKAGGCAAPAPVQDDGSNAGRPCCKRTGLVRHTVKRGGEALDSIANFYCSSVAELRRLNPSAEGVGTVAERSVLTIPPPINCGDGRQPMGAAAKAAAEQQCKCPTTTEYARARSREETCASVLAAAGLTGSCVAGCQERDDWTSAGCEAPQKAPPSGEKLPAGGAGKRGAKAKSDEKGDKPGASCPCPGAEAYAKALENKQPCSQAFEGLSLTDDCAVSCSKARAWLDAVDAASGRRCGPSLSAGQGALLDHAPGTRLAGLDGWGDPDVPVSQVACSRHGSMQHVVAEGEYAVLIARSTCSALLGLQKANPTQNMDALRVDTDLVIPPPCVCPPEVTLREALASRRTCESVLDESTKDPSCAVECKARREWDVAGCGAPPTSTSTPTSPPVVSSEPGCACPDADMYTKLREAGQPCDAALQAISSMSCRAQCQGSPAWRDGGCPAAERPPE